MRVRLEENCGFVGWIRRELGVPSAGADYLHSVGLLSAGLGLLRGG
jgi:hypothetical protein